MSTYYNFYMGKQNKDGQYEFIGPYIKNKEGKIKVEPLFWRSRSFIHWDDFDPYASGIAVEKMTDEVKEICAWEGLFDTDIVSYGYWIPLEKLILLADDEPIRGFLPIEEAKGLVASGYDCEYIEWIMESTVLPSEVVAGMTNEERSKYSFVSYIDRGSTKYQAAFILKAINEYPEWNTLNEGEELGVIVQIG